MFLLLRIKDLFKSSTRKRIEAQIAEQNDLLNKVRADKQKALRFPDQYAKLWSVEKDYQRNIVLLKSLL